MSDANKHSAIKGYGDALKQEAELENARYKNDSSLRSSNDDMAGLFSSISEAAKSPSGRPRGIGASIAAGFSEGISTGYKMKSTNEKKEKFGKYENVMNYLQKTQAEVTKQNQHYAEQEQRMETVKPFAVGALEVAYSGMDYNQGNERMRNIIEQAKLADPSIKGDYIGYVPNSPIVNLRDQNGNITAFSLSSLTGEEPAKRIQHNYIEQQKLGNLLDNTEVTKFSKGVPGKYDSKSEGFGADNKFEHNGESFDVVPLRGMTSSEKTDYGKGVNRNVLNIPMNERAIKSVHDMRAVFERNPNIGESWVNMLSSGENEDSWGTYIAKTFTSQKERSDMEILKKASADLNLATVLSVPGKSATDLLKQAIKAASPTGFLTKVGFDKVANDWEERAMGNITYAQAQAQARAQGKMLIMKSSGSQNSIKGDGGQQSSPLAAFGKKVN